MAGEVPRGLLERDGQSLCPAPDPGERTYLTEDAHGLDNTVTDRLEQLGYLE
jgi:hypothetical protein